MNRFVLAKIENVKESPFVMERSHHTLDNVVDVGVIPSSRSVSVLVNRFARVNAASELMDGQVWSLPRSVNREETQRDHPQLIKMRIG